MAKLTLNPVGSFSQTAITTINANMDAIEAAVEKTLSRDGTTPNQMTADLDMNHNDIINVDNFEVEDLIIDTLTAQNLVLPNIADDELLISNNGVIEGGGPKSQFATAAQGAKADSAVQPNHPRLLPVGGMDGQILVKDGFEDGIADWTSIAAGAGDMLSTAYDPEATGLPIGVFGNERQFRVSSRDDVPNYDLADIEQLHVLRWSAASRLAPAIYTRVAQPANVEPTHAGKVQSQDGIWFELFDKVVSPATFGALYYNYTGIESWSASGKTANSTAFENAIAYCVATNSKLDDPRNAYLTDKPWLITAGQRPRIGKLVLDFSKLLDADRNMTSSASNLVYIKGANPTVVGNLTVDALARTGVITVGSVAAALVSVGDLLLILSDRNITSQAANFANSCEPRRVRDVDVGAGTITLEGMLLDNYLTSDTARVLKLDTTTGLDADDLTIIGQGAGKGERAIYQVYAYKTRIGKLHQPFCERGGLTSSNCMNTSFDHIKFDGCAVDFRIAYGLSESGCWNTIGGTIEATKARHAYTNNSGGSEFGEWCGDNSVINRVISRQAYGGAVDGHPGFGSVTIPVVEHDCNPGATSNSGVSAFSQGGGYQIGSVRTAGGVASVAGFQSYGFRRTNYVLMAAAGSVKSEGAAGSLVQNDNLTNRDGLVTPQKTYMVVGSASGEATRGLYALGSEGEAYLTVNGGTIVVQTGGSESVRSSGSAGKAEIIANNVIFLHNSSTTAISAIGAGYVGVGIGSRVILNDCDVIASIQDQHAQVSNGELFYNNVRVTTPGLATELISAGGVYRTTGFNAPNPATFRNYLDNANFEVWQRGTSFASVAATRVQTADRWFMYRATTGITATRQAGFNGQRYCARLQRTAADTDTNSVFFLQQIPTIDAIKLAGQRVVFTIDARAGANYSGGTLSCRLFTGTGVDQTITPTSTSAGWTGGASTSLNLGTPTTTGARYKLVYDIPAGTTEVAIRLTYAPTGTAGAADYLEFGRAQIEPVTVSYAYSEFKANDYLTDLNRAMFFFQKSFLYGTAPAQNAGIGTGGYRDVATLAGAVTNRLGTVQLKTPMRAVPTVTLYNPAAANAEARDIVAGADCSSTAATNVSEGSFEVTTVGNASTAVGNNITVHWAAAADLSL